MTRVFITGATGQDGSYLVERLVAEGAEVHALVRRRFEPGANALPSEVVEHVADLATPAALRDAINAAEPDVIYNLGGISSVAASWADPLATSAVTGTAVGVILETAWQLRTRHDRDVRVIQASSAEIFAGTSIVPQNESTPVSPINPYGAAKSYAAHLVDVYRRRGLHASSAILYNHESPRRPIAFVTRKITNGAAAIAAGTQDQLTLGDLTVRRDWGWAPDFVDALVRIASADRPSDYVVATGVSHTIEDFLTAAFDEAGIGDWRPYVQTDPRFIRPTDAADLRGDASKIAEELGWTPSVGFEDLVRRMVRHDVGRADTSVTG
ncbi:GDP-mannose 4,6-dehydratase [Agromyces aureus]|uniref:GDP-mannose 4,6-dehydratase n=1 Tax=Agromyces aureus TaxID=453304 RepID=A0A191WHL4_9MICO|nr:GDP-mannose 4,6-dehydratase [Agromyces aureus]ANJ27668.1 GDP-mannose 4,6 dehydratase [Agromyces aureus]